MEKAGTPKLPSLPFWFDLHLEPTLDLRPNSEYPGARATLILRTGEVIPVDRFVGWHPGPHFPPVIQTRFQAMVTKATGWEVTLVDQDRRRLVVFVAGRPYLPRLP